MGRALGPGPGACLGERQSIENDLELGDPAVDHGVQFGTGDELAFAELIAPYRRLQVSPAGLLQLRPRFLDPDLHRCFGMPDELAGAGS
jgi:hypothetical protein